MVNNDLTKHGCIKGLSDVSGLYSFEFKKIQIIRSL